MTKYHIDIDKLILQDIDDPSLQRLFREIERSTLYAALIGADNKTVEKCCRNMSVRGARTLKETVEYGGKTSSYIQERRREIIEITQRLADRGEIYFEKGFRREDYKTVIEEIEQEETLGEKLPASITSNKKITVLQETPVQLLQPDTGSLSRADFVALYYQYMTALYRFHNKAKWEGLLALEEELADIENEFLHFGIQMITDGTDGSIIRSILSNYIAHETNYYKRILKRVIMEGILGIQGLDPLEMLIITLNSMVSIKDNFISAKITEYLCGDIHALETCFDTITHCRPAPEEREEIVFIKRAFVLSEKARREGLLALDAELDKAGIAAGDIFEYGLPLVIDGEDLVAIERILANLVAREHDPVKKNLCEAKKEVVLAIQRGEPSRVLLARCLSYFDDDIRQIVKKSCDFEW
jgi:flagellar motor component MotA